jgi:hypothetical protein
VAEADVEPSTATAFSEDAAPAPRRHMRFAFSNATNSTTTEAL